MTNEERFSKIIKLMKRNSEYILSRAEDITPSKILEMSPKDKKVVELVNETYSLMMKIIELQNNYIADYIKDLNKENGYGIAFEGINKKMKQKIKERKKKNPLTNGI